MVQILVIFGTEPRNYYSQLVAMKRHDGEPLFRVLQVQLVCDACRLAGKIECAHQGTKMPSWKTGERQELVKTLMSRNSEMFLREAAGVITNSSKNAFTREYVDRMALPENHVCISDLGPQKELFIAFDPAGGAAEWHGCSPWVPPAARGSAPWIPVAPAGRCPLSSRRSL